MDYASLRKSMVDEQLIPRGIKSKRVLDIFRKVERHKFIPEELLGIAYKDSPVFIGEGQTISQPYIVALMTECLDLNGTEKVLEIGTGCGYQTAIIAECAAEIYSIERIDRLSKKAELTLQGLNYTNIKFKVGDGTCGWIENQPFSRIIITAAAPEIPIPLLEQLEEGGKLVAPVGESFGQILTVVEKKNGVYTKKNICGCVFVPLIGKYGYKE